MNEVGIEISFHDDLAKLEIIDILFGDIKDIKVLFDNLKNGTSNLDKLKKSIVNSLSQKIPKFQALFNFLLSQKNGNNNNHKVSRLKEENQDLKDFLLYLAEKITKMHKYIDTKPDNSYSIEKISIDADSSNGKVYVVDGANICGIEKDLDNKPMLSNLFLLLKYLEEKGIDREHIKIFCDASLRHHIDNKDDYEELIERKIIKESPAGIKADKFILKYCLNHDETYFISNDLMREYKHWFPTKEWLKEKRIGIMKEDNEFILLFMDDNLKF